MVLEIYKYKIDNIIQYIAKRLANHPSLALALPYKIKGRRREEEVVNNYDG